jgi:hypothetical protein
MIVINSSQSQNLPKLYQATLPITTFGRNEGSGPANRCESRSHRGPGGSIVSPVLLLDSGVVVVRTVEVGGSHRADRATGGCRGRVNFRR